MVLAAVQHLRVNAPVVRAPGQVGNETLLGEIRHVHPHGAVLVKVIHAHLQQFAVHPVHRVFQQFQFSGAGLDIEQGEVRHPGLILLVKGQLAAVGGPFIALPETELAAHHGAAEHDIAVVGLADIEGLPVLFPQEGVSVQAHAITGDAALEGIIGLRTLRFVGGKVLRVLQAALEELPIPLGKEEMGSVQPAGLRPCITYAPENGLFHGEVFTGVTLAYVNDVVLCKRKSTGEEGACNDK